MASHHTLLAALMVVAACSFDPSGKGHPVAGDPGGGGGGGSADDDDGSGVIGGESSPDAGTPGAPDGTAASPPRVLTASGDAITVGNLGGNGGDDFLVDCGPNYLVTGLDAEDNDFGLCRLKATCGEVVVDGDMVQVVTTTQTAQFGDSPSYYNLDPVSCPAGAVVVGYLGSESSQDLVHSIRLACANVEWDGTTLSFGSSFLLPSTLGSPSQGGLGSGSCPDGQVAAGIEGKAGTIIDRFQLRCYQPVANEI